MVNLYTSDGQQVVALVLDEEGALIDATWNWESAQNYALSQGMRIVAIADDGGMTADEIQRLCNAERDRFIDCFITNA